MPNLGSVLKHEIARIARREIRTQTGTAKKTSAQHRRHIASLRRRIEALEKKVTSLTGRLAEGPRTSSDDSAGNQLRFVAKGVRSLRNRLGLSAERFGRLVGVSGQSIYNWERQIATPRAEQLRLLASIRGMGKREAVARLETLEAGPGTGPTPRARSAPRARA